MYYGGLYLNNTAMPNANIEKVEGWYSHRLFGNGILLGAFSRSRSRSRLDSRV